MLHVHYSDITIYLVSTYIQIKLTKTKLISMKHNNTGGIMFFQKIKIILNLTFLFKNIYEYL